jgi:hypothetical protein
MPSAASSWCLGPYESADEFVDCSEGDADDDVCELLDRILASDGFVSITP